MTKLCARGKAAAKRKFKVYPSAYANAYASKICAGKAKDPSGVKRKDWGPKKMMIGGFGIFSKKKNDKEEAKKSTQEENANKKKKRLEELKKEIGAKEGVSVRPYNPKDKKQKKITDRQNPISEYDPKTKKLKYTAVNTGGSMKIKKVIKGLKKASKLHAGQAKTLSTIKLSRGGGAAIKGTNFKGIF